MEDMKTASVRQLRNNFNEVEKYLRRGEIVQILKRGKAVARLIPEPTQTGFLGACPSSNPPADLDEPVSVSWE